MASPTRSRHLLAPFLAAAACASAVHAAADPQQASTLGTTLTEFGAEQAGNAGGTIPEYAGGIPAMHLGPSHGEFFEQDPFGAEQPLRVITAANAGEAEAQLTAGTRELLQKYPTFRVDVYPTHRTAAYPRWLLDNTKGNATRASATDGGLGMKGALPGVPFPIPADGYEVMWNHRLRYMGDAVDIDYQAWLEDAAGQSVLAGAGLGRWEFPLYEAKHRDQVIKQDELVYRWKVDYTGPQRRAGEAMLMLEVVNPLLQGRRVWSYVPGQRRVRLLNMQDDTPSSSSSGAYIVDDAFVFNGTLERFDVKLLGKREMLMPYNTYRMTYHTKAPELLRPGHLNPDVVRWELHRVWVVDATLKPGQTHPYSHRVFYVDEDTWTALASDEYGTDGKLLRSVFTFPTFGAETGIAMACNFVPYSFATGAYYVSYHPDSSTAVRYVQPLDDSGWSPDALAGSGVR